MRLEPMCIYSYTYVASDDQIVFMTLDLDDSLPNKIRVLIFGRDVHEVIFWSNSLIDKNSQLISSCDE